MLRLSQLWLVATPSIWLIPSSFLEYFLTGFCVCMCVWVWSGEDGVLLYSPGWFQTLGVKWYSHFSLPNGQDSGEHQCTLLLLYILAQDIAGLSVPSLSPGINHFSKEAGSLLVENGVFKQIHCYQGVTSSRYFQWTQLGRMHLYRNHIHICIYINICTYIYLSIKLKTEFTLILPVLIQYYRVHASFLLF